MSKEIERKFLVNEQSQVFKALIDSLTGENISQGYLSTDFNKTVRVRRADSGSTITIKGKQIGVTRPEFEYEIPNEDAEEMLALCKAQLEKVRFRTDAGNGLTWEIDIFGGSNKGLIVAEIELPSEDTYFEVPEWLGQEVSQDMRFQNLNIAQFSYRTWNMIEKKELDKLKTVKPK